MFETCKNCKHSKKVIILGKYCKYSKKFIQSEPKLCRDFKDYNTVEGEV